MRDWTLGPGDPLSLTLAADFRLCTPDYVNDHIWEVETGSGDPPALSLATTYGLRARRMRLFPRFTLDSQSVTDPASFSLPPRLRSFFPNYLSFDFSPFANLEVTAEYWVPDSQTLAGRITVTNAGETPLSLLLELCGQLAPLEGQPLASLSIQSVNVLSGYTADLAPVVFLTGGPQPGPGPYPSLALPLAMVAGAARTLTWVQAALSSTNKSFDLARRVAARPWESERARIEMLNAAQTVEIHTGDPDWDAALALSQKSAFGLFFRGNQHLPNPSFVLARQPDQGYSLLGSGRDYSPLWSGQPILEAVYLASLLPGAPHLAAGLVRNFLAVQSPSGAVDCKPGLAGQRERWLAALSWRISHGTPSCKRVIWVSCRRSSPGWRLFSRCWAQSSHDRDGDGFPEWDHPSQAGLEDNPLFTLWQSDGMGADISATESPALVAMLCRESRALANIAAALGQSENHARWEMESERLRLLAEECWDSHAALYHLRDISTHLSPPGKTLAARRRPGKISLNRSFRQPVRLLVRLELKGDVTRHPGISLHGQNGDTPQTERLARGDFQWGTVVAVATSRMVYTSLEDVEVVGLEKRDRVTVSVMDLSFEDVTLFLPLWAHIPEASRARELVDRTLLAPDRFGAPYGIPVCVVVPALLRDELVPALGRDGLVPAQALKTSSHSDREKISLPPPSASLNMTQPVSFRETVQLPWNALIGEGLLGYGLRREAADLTARLMAAVVHNLKREHSFRRSYHASSGEGIGGRNPLQGLAPVGLFLDTLGIRFESAGADPVANAGAGYRVVLNGKNPFPWPVTVKYRGLTITRQSDQTVVGFPDGQTVTLDDPTDAVVTAG